MMLFLKSRFCLSTFLMIFFCSSALAVKFDDCHPSLNASIHQYVVGYGSLIKEESKRRTHKEAGESIPVIIKGYERVWNVRIHQDVKTTFLGVRVKPFETFNAVIFSVNEEGIRQFDERESLYCRKRVEKEEIEMMESKNIPEGEIWMYVPKPEADADADEEHPIKQSYVDLFVSGCIEIEEKHHVQDYAFQCIDSTKGWSQHWINDRDRSTYPEKPKEEDLPEINFVFETKLPHIFNRILG